MPRLSIRRKLCSLILFFLLLFALPLNARAKTYIITDGSRMVTYAGAAAAAEAAPDLPQMRQVFLSCRGEAAPISTDCETVGQLLLQLELDITDTDTLSPAPDTPITEGLSIQIDSTVTRRETYTTTIPREVRYCKDDSLPEGTTQVLVEGRDGELLCSADITYHNGTEIKREILAQTQTIAPIARIIAQGTAVPAEPEEPSDMPIVQDGYILMPTGEILTYYKTDYVTATGYTHTDSGCDMITATGTTVHYGTVAVDPRFIPYGTRMLVMSHDGERYYGIATAEDCGGAIKRDKMDLYFPTYQECIEFGRRRCTIYFLG